MRSRPPVGRRLWRRRRRRTADAEGGANDGAGGAGGIDPRAAQAAGDDGDDGHNNDNGDDNDNDDDGAAGDGSSAPDDVPSPDDARTAEAVVVEPPARAGFFARLFGRARATTKPLPPAPIDPTRAILALPRGAARLDAFARKVMDLAPGDDVHKKVALAFHDELVQLSRDAGVDLALLEPRVLVCAQALITAGEFEKAADLHAALGQRERAAELYAQAGAIDALEEQHAELAFQGGGARLDARLAFERHETLLTAGRRDEALAALELAVSLSNTPAYAEALASLRARLPGRVVTLAAGDDVVRVVTRLPCVLGRGETADVRFDHARLSKRHAELSLAGAEVVVRDLGGAAATLLDNRAVTRGAALPPSSTLSLANLLLDVERTAARVTLRPRLRPRELVVVALGDVVDGVIDGVTLVMRDGRTYLRADPRVAVDGEQLRSDLLVWNGDRIAAAGRTWLVGPR